jgi:enterochelin esterase-like enzyme
VEGDVSEETYTYQVYLPGCYAANPDGEFPMLMLFDGLSASDSLWVELGIAQIADNLTRERDIPPLVIVLPAGKEELGYQDGLIDILLPEVQATLRVRPGREWRAIGGISRGAAWASRIAWKLPGDFSAIGLHSPEMSTDEAYALHGWLESFDGEDVPRVWIDVGENDTGSDEALFVKRILEHIPVIPTWHQWPGGHDEEYWSSHLEEYLRWYSELWPGSTNVEATGG